MQDDSPSYDMASTMPPKRRGSVGRQLLITLLAFLLGGGLVGYLAWSGELSRYLPPRAESRQSRAADSGEAGIGGAAPPAAGALRDQAAVGSLEARLAMLEDRFSRLDFEARAASGNASRAEALLIATSARRAIERGEPLGPIEDQLRLRFAGAQPQAVDAIITFAQAPVTIDQLTARLEALAPDLTGNSQDASLWERTREELASLFRVRSDSPTLLAPTARIERARLMLTARRVRSAIGEVERLPGADAADKWVADAQRFGEVQRALDLIETTAMLEPRRLKDGSGQEVSDASPLSTVRTEPAAPSPLQGKG
jgi:hypothetical protein